MDWPVIFEEIFWGGLKTVLLFSGILMALMILLELIRDANILDRAAVWLKPFMRLFRLPQEGAFPLLAGIFFGISYGSGVIIPFSRDGSLSTRDLTVIGVFLALCHGMIEDPLIFAAMGASWWIVVGVRVMAAVTAMFIFSRLLKRPGPEGSELPGTSTGAEGPPPAE